MLNLFDLVDVRLLLVLSPIATAIAWAMLIHEEPSLKYPWWF
ncbi:MAG: hypothetical protein AAFN08_15340 [Cyanobacteria bacterium J06559_3]